MLLGSNGRDAFAELNQQGSAQFVPVENGVEGGEELFNRAAGEGAGSIDGHWDTDFLPGELMVFRIDPRQRRFPLSEVSIRSLQDLRYRVDASLADEYSIETFQARSSLLRGADERDHEMIDLTGDIPLDLKVVSLDSAFYDVPSKDVLV